MTQTIIHLIYIHGFQGNDSTFQSFPTHLQASLAARMPPHFRVQSSLYPTYKSVKPISYATKNFLEWLSTQPPGYVILLGHSMGGLLAADAATHPSVVQNSRPQHIIGMIAFDTPFLGMHPHVVISGIASLFPDNSKKDNKNQLSESETRPTPQQTDESMNDKEQVHIVDQGVTDDWNTFKGRLSPSQWRRESGSLPHSPPGPSSSPSPSHTPSTFLSQFTARVTPYVDRTVSHPAIRWVNKHSDSPVDAGKTWIIEHFQFGSCMFDPPGLHERYTRLVKWRGQWTNYWTRTKPRGAQPQLANVTSNPLDVANAGALPTPTGTGDMEAEIATDNSPQGRGISGSLNDVNAPVGENAEKVDDKERKKALKKAKKEHEKRLKREKKLAISRNFVVLPKGFASGFGGWDKWESVEIAGVEDEVAAHCGLFIPSQNIGYQDLVDGATNKVLCWCESIRIEAY